MARVTPRWLPRGGETGALIRSIDWTRTGLGSPASWPQSLRTSLSICLDSGFPVLLWWGPSLVMLYNDAYRPMLGDKHPRAMGQAGRECWPEIWDTIGPMLEDVLRHGRTSYFEDLMLPLRRRGFAEECYFTFTYSPIRDESGGVGGVFCAVTETTQRVYGERQLGLLRDLAATTADARTFDAAVAASMACLSRAQRDLPFALLYLDDPERKRLVLAGAAGAARTQPDVPECIARDMAFPWPPSAGIAAGGTPLPVVDVPPSLQLHPVAPGTPPVPVQALAVPITPAGHGGRSGLLVAGLSPMRVLDEDYIGFLRLVAGQVSAAIGNAQAYEEERKRAESLAEIDRAKTAFFSNVSHEFRTPLTLLMSPIEDLLGQDLPTDGHEALALAHRNAVRLQKLVNMLLDVARIDSARVQATYEPVDLAALTADLAGAFRSLIEKAGLNFHVDCPPLPEPIWVDREMWERIVANLLSNAFKFTFEGEIAVSLQWLGDRARLDVRDTGTGIPEHEIPRLFERFHRVPHARGRSIEGTGIGLTLTRELVRFHGGSIDVESAPGRGTTFRVEVPAGRAHLPADRVRLGAPRAAVTASVMSYVEEALHWTGGVAFDGVVSVPGIGADAQTGIEPARVLVADDNADMRSYLVRLLGRHWTVEAVPDGAAALDAARRNTPDLLVSDIMMPGVDGFELVQRLRADVCTRELPIILLSARAGDEARALGIDAGADDYLVKPFSARELIARVRTHLKLGRMRSDARRAVQELADQLQSANAALVESDRRKNEFLAVLSHELRNPLTSVRNSLHLLDHGPLGGPPAAHAVATIQRQIGQLSRLVDDLLEVNRISTGKMQVRREPLDLVPLVRGLAADHAPIFSGRGIAFETSLAAAPAWVDGDAARLAQAVGNLLQNAAKFTPEGGSARVSVTVDDGAAIVCVQDTGAGIEPDLIEHIFDPFTQADRTLDRSRGGLGLGLALVAGIVRLHEGSVRAESEGPGRGSRFTIRLPLITTPATVRQETARAPGVAPGPGRRVLVIEDNVDAAESLQALLGLYGHTVEIAHTGQEGLEVFRRFRPDAVLCDIGLPEMDGYDVARAIRAEADGARVLLVALTGYGMEDDQRQARSAGFDEHLTKPVQPDRLLRLIAENGTADAGSR